MSLQPWETTWNGYRWYDMPGSDVLAKRMNFFFFRRGTLDLEDEKACDALAADGIVEISDGAGRGALPRLVSRAQKRFGGMGRKSVRKHAAEGPKVNKPGERFNQRYVTAEEQQWRAQVRLALAGQQKAHFNAVTFVAKQAGIKPATLRKWLREGSGLGKEHVERVEKVIKDVKSGALTIELKLGRNPNGAQKEAPEGMVPFKDWLHDLALAKHTTVPTLRAWLKNHPEALPKSLFKMNKRCFFVSAQEVAA